MSRKQTIFIAVLINSGLLLLLCLVALTSEEEVNSLDIALQPHRQELSDPKTTIMPESAPPLLPLAAEIVHTLPPLLLPIEPPSAPSFVVPPPQVTQPASTGIAPFHEAHLLEVTVRSGDTLEKIARSHHITVDELIKCNQLPSTFLRIGQVLRIPAAHGQPPQKAKSAPPMERQEDYYVVKVGDNPWTIAMKHHMKVDELLRLNSLNEEKAKKLKPGDRIRIR